MVDEEGLRGCVTVAMSRAIAACGRVHRLPGVPTLDWCERAAAALAVLVPDGGVVVGLARLEGSGHVAEVVNAGAALGAWARGAPGALDLRLGMEALRDAPWPAEHVGRLWNWIPGADVAWGTAPLEGGRTAMLVSAAGPSGGGPLRTAIRELMNPLTEAARRAFGTGTLKHSDWLSPREQEVLSALLLGKSIREIAAESGRSAHTVHDHVKSLHRKLHASSRGELVARALGYIEHSPGAGRPAAP